VAHTPQQQQAQKEESKNTVLQSRSLASFVPMRLHRQSCSLHDGTMFNMVYPLLKGSNIIVCGMTEWNRNFEKCLTHINF
jgi:hypothetical protein